MNKYTQDQIDEKIQKLPQALQDSLFSPSIAEKIFDLGVENNLNIEQAGVLGEEVGNIILGFIRPEDFAKVLRESLQIAEADAKKIAGEINQAILVPLRDLLKSAHGIDVKGEAVSGTPVFMQKPSAPPPEPKPEWIIKPELKPRQDFAEQNLGGPPKVILPEKEIQIPLPTSRPNPPPTTSSIQPSTIDLKNTLQHVVSKVEPLKLPEGTPPSKVPPIDLRTQAKPRDSQDIYHETPVSTETPQSTPTPPPALKPTPAPKAVPDKGVDLYREPIE